MSGRPRRVALTIAVVTGVLGGSLIGAGALGFDRAPASAAAVCPDGTVLFQAVRPQLPDPGASAGVQPAVDETDPFASTVADPDSYLCVVPGVGAAPGQPIQPSPAAAGETAGYTIPAPMPNPGSIGGADPTPGPTPSSPPAPGLPDPEGLPPGLIPSAGDPSRPAPQETVQPRNATTDRPVGESGPNDGGEPPSDLPAPPADVDPVQGKAISRAEVIGRAVSWVLQQVPYSQTSWWSDSNGTYRQDCSGYVSMAWNLNQRINYWTGNLATVSHRIASSALKPGDILLLPRSHVVLFAGWANSAKTKFHMYEEYSRGKPARYVTDANLSYYLNRGYGAYRYDKIADVKRGRSGPQSTVYELASFSRPLTVSADDASDGITPIGRQPDGVSWTPAVAEEHEPERQMPAGRADQITLAAVPDLPVETLVDAQLTTDLRALAAARDSERGDTGMLLIGAGFGLLFLGFPLSIAARAGVWNPAQGRRPEPQP